MNLPLQPTSPFAQLAHDHCPHVYEQLVDQNPSISFFTDPGIVLLCLSITILGLFLLLVARHALSSVQTMRMFSVNTKRKIWSNMSDVFWINVRYECEERRTAVSYADEWEAIDGISVSADLYRREITLRSSVGIFSSLQKNLSFIALREWMVSDTDCCNSTWDWIDQWSTCLSRIPISIIFYPSFSSIDDFVSDARRLNWTNRC